MERKNDHRNTIAMLIAAGALIAFINFSVADISNRWQMISLLISVVASAIAAFLCAYVIGFTTIRMSLVAIAVVAIMLSVWVDNFPARMRFRFAKLEFENVLVDLQGGGQVEFPVWIGTFHVKKIQEMESGEIRFWTVEHPSGNTGIVFSPDGNPELNELLELEMDKNWHVVCVD